MSSLLRSLLKNCVCGDASQIPAASESRGVGVEGRGMSRVPGGSERAVESVEKSCPPTTHPGWQTSECAHGRTPFCRPPVDSPTLTFSRRRTGYRGGDGCKWVTIWLLQRLLGGQTRTKTKHSLPPKNKNTNRSRHMSRSTTVDGYWRKISPSTVAMASGVVKGREKQRHQRGRASPCVRNTVPTTYWRCLGR